MSDLRTKLIRLAHSEPKLRPHLLPLLTQKRARVTGEPLRLKYMNLGDFRGTVPTDENWILEVAGPTFDYKDEFKRLGLKWNSRDRTWQLLATKYKFGTPKTERAFARARAQQEKAYPALKALVKKHNDAVMSENEALTEPSVTPKDLMKRVKRNERRTQRLGQYGITIRYEWPSRYDVSEAKVWVLGNTFPIKGLMKKHGFRWGSSGKYGKGWYMPTVEYSVVGGKWANDVIKVLSMTDPTPGPAATSPLSGMSLPELKRWLEPVIEQDMVDNEYYDGEVTEQDLLRDYIRRIKRMSPEEQQEFYDRVESGGSRYAGAKQAFSVVEDIAYALTRVPYLMTEEGDDYTDPDVDGNTVWFSFRTYANRKTWRAEAKKHEAFIRNRLGSLASHVKDVSLSFDGRGQWTATIYLK
jgi:hypothetical protein